MEQAYRMNEPSLQQKYDFALDYIRSLEELVEELREQIDTLERVIGVASDV